MRHATPATIARIEPLLGRIRAFPGLVEKRPGIFYRKSRAFLHFHEEGGRIFADLRRNEPDFDRLPATTAGERDRLVRAIRQTVGEGGQSLPFPDRN